MKPNEVHNNNNSKKPLSPPQLSWVHYSNKEDSNQWTCDPSTESCSGPTDLPDVRATAGQGTDRTRQLVVLQNLGYYPRKGKMITEKGNNLISKGFVFFFKLAVTSHHLTSLFQLSPPPLAPHPRPPPAPK